MRRRYLTRPLAAVLVIAAVSSLSASSGAAPEGCGFRMPVPGVVTRPFAPRGPYSGHFGIDLGAAAGSTVRAAADGIVTFSGVVVANRTVTIHHGEGLRTSYSFLSSALVGRDERVYRGAPIGTSGVHGGREALHFSARVGSRYVDPLRLVRWCRSPGAALRLRSVLGGEAYPR